jgi:hypothetical protein
MCNVCALVFLNQGYILVGSIQLLILNRHLWQSSPFRAITFLRRIYHIWSSFHFFAFHNLFTEQGYQPCIQPPTWRTRSLYLSPCDRVAQLYPQELGSLFVTFYDSGLWWGYSNPPPHQKSLSILYFALFSSRCIIIYSYST